MGRQKANVQHSELKMSSQSVELKEKFHNFGRKL